MKGCLLGLAVLLGAWAAGFGVAGAQVLEIQDDGSVVQYDGPAVYLSTSIHTFGATRERSAPARSGGRAQPSTATSQAIRDASARHQVSMRLIEAVAWRESRFNPAAVSPKGARGVMQLMPGTARSLGVDADDPTANIDGGANYLSRMLRRFNGDLPKALAAYNAGPEAVARYGGVPPYAETVAYVDAVLGRLGGPASAAIAADAARRTLRTGF